MYHLISFITLLVILLLPSCGGRATVSSTLDAAESVMETAPDSAFALLESIDSTALTTASLSARHALLKSWSLYKSYKNVQDDSLINTAIDYYSSSGDKNSLAEAHFLRGKYLDSRGGMRDALEEFLYSEELLESSENHYLLGMVYQSISIILSSCYSVSESLKYSRRALDTFINNGDSSYIAYQKFSLGQICILADKYSEASELAKSAIEYAKEARDTNLLSNSLVLLSNAEYACDNIDSAYYHYLESKPIMNRQFSNEEKYFIANVCLAIGDMHKADSILSEMHESDPDAINPWEVLEAQGKYFEAYNTLNQVVDSMNGVLNNIVKQDVTMLLNDFSEKRAKELNEKQEKTMELIMVIAGLSIIVLIIAAIIIRGYIVTHRQKERLLSLEKNIFILKVENLTRDLKEASISRQDIEESLTANLTRGANFIASSYHHLDSLCRTYHENGIKKKGHDTTYAEIQELITGFNLGGSSLLSLEKDIDKLTDGAISKLKKGKSSFSDEDFQLMLLSIVGFSVQSISFIMNISPSIIYNRKSRLRSRLRNMDDSVADTILFYFK